MASRLSWRRAWRHTRSADPWPWGPPPRTRPAPPPAPGAERMFTPAEVRADFTALYDGLKQAQFDAFAHTPKAELDRAFRADMASFDRPMSLFEVQTRFQRFTARIRIAHPRVEFPTAAWDRYRASGGKAFPLYVRVE